MIKATKEIEQGYLSLILHGHLPYVRHPEHDFFLEELWFYEAISETYIPLILMMERLLEEKVDFRLTMTLSPPLISMFCDGLLQDRYMAHIEKMLELSQKEIYRTQGQPAFHALANMYYEHFLLARNVFLRYGKNLTTAFRNFQDAGKLEIITCGATHGFFPLMDVCRESVRAQVAVAVNQYKKVFGRNPMGIWLPECGYFPGQDEILKENGIKYFIVDVHGILHATPRPKFGNMAPIYCKSGVACFARDVESSKQVWSSIEGYPGDFYYRDFYRDIGFDLDLEYILPYIHPDGIRVHTGIKYYRITGKEGHKEPYERDKAIKRAAEHAGNFMFNRQLQVQHFYHALNKKPVIVAPYDAELFGHWWFEGPQWLEFLIRKLHYDQSTIRMVTPYQYLQENPCHQVATPSMSSWGYKGYCEVWLMGRNDWIYRHLHKASERMTELARRFDKNHINPVQRRALNQALRELLLAQSSDWAFIMANETHTSYAVKRTKSHLSRFNRLYEEIKKGKINMFWLEQIEAKDNIFPDIDFKVHQ